MKRFLPVAIVAALIVAGVVISLSVGGGGDPPGMLEINRPLNPPESEFTQLTPGDAEFARLPGNFSDFPLYWLGNEFGGHSLRYIVRQVFTPPDQGMAYNSVAFLYGTCSDDPSVRCQPPLQIVVEPYCLVSPELVGNGTRPANMVKVRGGADAVNAGGGLRIWTGDVTLNISASTPELLDAATAGFYSSNGLGPAGAGDTLPAPNPDCSDYESIPFTLD